MLRVFARSYREVRCLGKKVTSMQSDCPEQAVHRITNAYVVKEQHMTGLSRPE
jgi:hypothetical protein